MAKAIPERWLIYSPLGKIIPDTRFIAFKVPLRETVLERVPKNIQLSMRDLIEKIPNLGLIIDLTNTKRYYDSNYFVEKGLNHIQINVPGHHVPSKELINKFKMAVFSFLNKNTNNDKIIGVHCTHGVNRTGFMICHFMISEMQMEPSDAIEKFGLARGHYIERANYIEALYAIKGLKPPKKTVSESRLIENFDSSQSSLADIPPPSRFARNPLDNWRVKGSSSNYDLYDYRHSPDIYSNDREHRSNNYQEHNIRNNRKRNTDNSRHSKEKYRTKSPPRRREPREQEPPLSWRNRSQQNQISNKSRDEPRQRHKEVRWDQREVQRSQNSNRRYDEDHSRHQKRRSDDSGPRGDLRSIQIVKSWPDNPYK